MAYDHIWICPNLNRSEWTDLRRDNSEKKTESPQDDYVVSMSAGENLCIDELYIFFSEDDARRFFSGPLTQGESGWRDRELHLREDNGQWIPKGFDHVRLYIKNVLVAEHSAELLKPSIANQGDGQIL
jgi:hypothetical protein